MLHSSFFQGRGMLKNTFCHIPGISPMAEQRLWLSGIDCWDTALNTNSVALPGRAAVDALRPDGVKLAPPVLCVGDPRADEHDVLAGRRHWEVASVAGHELNHQPAVLLGDIFGVDQSPVLAIEPDEDVEVAAVTELLGIMGLFVAAPLTVTGLVLAKMLYVEDTLGDEAVNVPGEPGNEQKPEGQSATQPPH